MRSLAPSTRLAEAARLVLHPDQFDVLVTGWDLEGRSWLIDRYTVFQAPDGRELRPAERQKDWLIIRDRLLRRLEAMLIVATMPRAHAVQVRLHADLQDARRCFFDGIGTFEQTDRGVLLHAQTDHLDWFAGELARLPFDFSIEQPDLLRDALAARARRLLDCAAGA